MREIYAEVALRQMPRILSLMDRKKSSPTYGCFDRNYWQIKMIDFGGSLFQGATLSLALAYSKEYPGNIYYKNQKIRDWAIAAAKFLGKIQNPDGSFSHNYPYIWSVAAVAFPVYSVSETFLLLKNEIDNSTKEIIIKTLEKAGKWLAKNFDEQVINQEAGAAMALYYIYEITKKDYYKNQAEEKIKRILAKQSPDGWFYEYGGGDVGYSTVCIDYLAKYWQKIKDKNVENALKKIIDFVSYFIFCQYFAR